MIGQGVVGRLLQALGLAGLWLLLLASTKPLDLLVGLVLGTALLAIPHPGRSLTGQTPPLARRALAFPRFALVVLADIVRGTADVALRVAHLRPLGRPGIVEVPIGERTQLGCAVTALVTTLSPGAVLVDIDDERGVMLVHVIDASDPDGFRERQRHLYERHQRKVFP